MMYILSTSVSLQMVHYSDKKLELLKKSGLGLITLSLDTLDDNKLAVINGTKNIDVMML